MSQRVRRLLICGLCAAAFACLAGPAVALPSLPAPSALPIPDVHPALPPAVVPSAPPSVPLPAVPAPPASLPAVPAAPPAPHVGLPAPSAAPAPAASPQDIPVAGPLLARAAAAGPADGGAPGATSPQPSSSSDGTPLAVRRNTIRRNVLATRIAVELRRIRACLDQLPAGERRLLEAEAGTHGPPRSPASAAALLGIPRSRAATVQRRALASLRTIARNGCPTNDTVATPAVASLGWPQSALIPAALLSPQTPAHGVAGVEASSPSQLSTGSAEPLPVGHAPVAASGGMSMFLIIALGTLALLAAVVLFLTARRSATAPLGDAAVADSLPARRLERPFWNPAAQQLLSERQARERSESGGGPERG